MAMRFSDHGGARPGAGRKPNSRNKNRGERSRVSAALASEDAAVLFVRAQQGSFAAAAALVSLLKSAERLALLPLEREAARERAPTNFFWLRRSGAYGGERELDLFATGKTYPQDVEDSRR